MGFENNIYFHAVLDPDPDGPSWVPALGAARSNFDKHVLGVPKNKKKCAQGESNPRQMLSTQIRNFWKASMLPLHHERFLVRNKVMKRHYKRLPTPPPPSWLSQNHSVQPTQPQPKTPQTSMILLLILLPILLIIIVIFILVYVPSPFVSPLLPCVCVFCSSFLKCVVS